jgi:hypothetical protein
MGEKPKPKPYISRLVVKAGKTSRPSEKEEWTRSEYEVEFTFPEGCTRDDFEGAKQAGLQAIQKWLNEKPKQAPPPPLEPAELEKLPWKPYKQGHRAAWVFVDKAEKLAQVIRHSETGKVTIGEFQYQFSGPKDNPALFINRTPIEAKKEVSQT